MLAMRPLSLAVSSFCFRRACRAYATQIPGSSVPTLSTTASEQTKPGNVLEPLPDANEAAFAQADSAPLKVKERRAQLSKEYALTKPSERSLSRDEKRKTVRPAVTDGTLRSRLRGVRTIKQGSKAEEQVVGQRIYLPNIIFTMMPNQTLPGKPYNPYEATFRIPNNITKTDIRGYLRTIYGVDCTYIRTDNRFKTLKYTKNVASGRQVKVNYKHSYKRAVVGLKDPFYFPQMVEDMNGKDRWLREASLEDDFHLKETKEMIRTGQSRYGSKKPEKAPVSRGKLLRTLWEKRLERERLAREFAERLSERQAQGTQVTESSS